MKQNLIYIYKEQSEAEKKKKIKIAFCIDADKFPDEAELWNVLDFKTLLKDLKRYYMRVIIEFRDDFKLPNFCISTDDKNYNEIIKIFEKKSCIHATCYECYFAAPDCQCRIFKDNFNIGWRDVKKTTIDRCRLNGTL